MSKKIEKPGVIVLVAIYTQVRSLFMTLADANFLWQQTFFCLTTRIRFLNRASGSKPSAVTIHPSETFETSGQMVQHARETGLRFNGAAARTLVSMRLFHKYYSRLRI